MLLYELDIKDIRKYIDDNKESININNTKIYLDRQKTGYGYKTLLICPKCGERRTKLYSKDNETIGLRCRSCIGTNIYKNRTDIYDEGGTELIEYKLYKLLKSIDYKMSITNKHIPFDYRLYWNCKPKYMRYNKFILILKQLTALSAMRDRVIIQKCNYDTRYVNALLNSNSLKSLEFNEIFDAIWFHKI